MTYCLGILSKHGVAGLADTRITSGRETTMAKKIFAVQRKKHSFFIMTSGLRSVRDKAITYFSEVIEDQDGQFDKLYKAVNKFSDQVKRVAEEDKKILEESGLDFNLYAIVGGQLENDKEPKLYLLYPQGNWIEVGPGTPFVIIGNTGFGSPILKRSLTYDSSLEFGLKSGFLSFDATRIASNDVAYPIDTIVLKKNEFNMIEHRFEEKDLGHISTFWDNKLQDAIHEMPADILSEAFKQKDNTLKVS